MQPTTTPNTVKPSITSAPRQVVVVGASHQIGTSLCHLLLRANIKVFGSARSAEHSRQLWELAEDYPTEFSPLSFDAHMPQISLPAADDLIVIIGRGLAYNPGFLRAFDFRRYRRKFCVHPELNGTFFQVAAAQNVPWDAWQCLDYPDDLPERSAKDLFAVVDRIFARIVAKGQEQPPCY